VLLAAVGCCDNSVENDKPSPKSKISAPSYFYSLGFTLGPIGAASFLICVGVWGLQDNYLFPEHPTYSSALFSVGVASIFFLAMLASRALLPASQAALDALRTLGSSVLRRDASPGSCDCSCTGEDLDYRCIGSIYNAYSGAAEDIPPNSQNRRLVALLETIPETACWLQSPTTQIYCQKWRTRAIPGSTTPRS
jgi:hypothetical protein